MTNTQGTLRIIKEIWQYSNTGKCIEEPREFKKIFTAYITIRD